MAELVIGEAEGADRRGGVAAADDGERRPVSVSAWATARVPPAKAGNSKTPMGPFQNTVLAPLIRSAKAAADSGPMSRPMP